MQASRDQNFVPVALGESNTTPGLTLPFKIDEVTGRLLVDAAGGGGGAPSSPDTSLQFNNGGSFGGSNLLYSQVTQEITLRVVEQSSSNTRGNDLNLVGSDGLGAARGGNLDFYAGQGGATSGDGGSVTIVGGDAQGGNSNGGNLTLQGGFKTGSGVYGYIRLLSGSNGDFAILDTANITGGNKTFSFPNETGTFVLVDFAQSLTQKTLVDAVNSVSVPTTTSVGYLGVPQNSQSAAYTTIMTDSGKHILHPTADNNARTFTIDSNANVAYPVGTAITFINQINTVTIAITSDTMTLAGAGTTGSRTLAANGVATAIKIATTSWMISGTGLT